MFTNENCETGKSVRRGKDWDWEDQDHQNGVPGKGVITVCQSTLGNQQADVKWDNGKTFNYRIGFVNLYDLYYAGNDK